VVRLRLTALRRLAFIALAALNLATVGLAVWSIQETWQAAIEAGKTSTTNLATAVERDIAGLMTRIDLALLNAGDEIARQPASGRPTTETLNAFMARQAARIPEAAALRFADADGHMLYGSSAHPRINIADREHFMRAREQRGEGLIVGKPVLTRLGQKWVLPVTKRIDSKNGNFAGIVYVFISLERLATDFSRIDVGLYGGVALRDGEMGLIVRVPELKGIGAQVGDRSVSQTARDMAAAKAHAATYIATTPADGRKRIVALRRVEAQPLYVAVTLAEEEYLAAWRAQAARTAALTFAVVLLSLFVARMMVRSWRHGLAEVDALAESQQLLRTVTEHVHDWIYWRNVDHGTFHYLSPAGETITGYARADFEADPGLLDRIIHPDDRARWDAHLRDKPNNHEHADEEYRIFTRQGEVRWINHACREVVAPDGTRLGRCGTNQDITAAKLLHRRLADSEAHLRAIIDNEPECVKLVSLDGMLLQMNPAGLAMIEADSAAQVIGRPVVGIVAPAHREAFLALCQKIYDGGSGTLEFEVVGLKGGRRWLETHAVPMRDAEGKITGLLGITRDITRSKAAEDKLVDSGRRMRAVIDASDESTLLLDPAGNLLAINRVGARRFGQTPEQMLGANFFAYLPPDLAESRRAVLQRVIETGDPLRIVDQRGQISFENSIFPVKNDAGIVESIAVYAKDISERRRDEQTEALFHRVDLMLLRWQMNAPTIAQMFCEGLLPLFDLAAAWVARVEQNGELTMLATVARESGATDFAGHVRREFRRWRDGEKVCVTAGEVVSSGQERILDIASGGCPACASAGREIGAVATLLMPLTMRGETWGVLALYSREDHLFGVPEISSRLTSITGRFATLVEAALQQEWLALLETALATASNAAFITDAGARILWVNRAFTALSGYASDELLGAHDAEFYRRFWATLQAGESWQGEVVNARRDGSRYTVNQTVTPLRNAAGDIGHYVSILEDITERKAAAARIEHMANFDALTELPNRNLFFDRLGQALTFSRRDGRPGALLFLDLDRFKAVNDSLGHEAGDQLLKAVTARCLESVRESDTVARLAGDEFTVLLPSIAGADDAARVAGKIVAAIGQPFDLGGREVEIGVSVGIALYPQHGDNVEVILNAADDAMYEAKRAGRNTHRFFVPRVA